MCCDNECQKAFSLPNKVMIKIHYVWKYTVNDWILAMPYISTRYPFMYKKENTIGSVRDFHVILCFFELTMWLASSWLYSLDGRSHAQVL